MNLNDNIDILSNKEDAAIFKHVWYQNSDNLGPLYKDYIQDVVKRQNCLCYRRNNIPYSFLVYKLNDRNNEIVIDALFTDFLQRNEGMATNLLKQFYQLTKGFYHNLSYNLTITLNYDNPYHSYFINKSTRSIKIKSRKGTIKIKYYLDLHKLSSM